jgi:hypothetical protein
MNSDQFAKWYREGYEQGVEDARDGLSMLSPASLSPKRAHADQVEARFAGYQNGYNSERAMIALVAAEA